MATWRPIARRRGPRGWPACPGGPTRSASGGAPADRPVDVQRLGRQPPDWDDDDRNRTRLAAEGLTFAGRPREVSYKELLGAHLQRARCVLAHSNLADGAHYTHPTKAYMTARWTDAFACGCIVAGVPPAGDPLLASVDPEAMAAIGPDAGPGTLSALRAAVAAWTPARGRRIHEMALRDFDWRWRFRDLAAAMEIDAPFLDAEIRRIVARLPAAPATRPARSVR